MRTLRPLHVPSASYAAQCVSFIFANLSQLRLHNQCAHASNKQSTQRDVQSGPAVFEALFNTLRTVTNESTVQYTLALLDDIVARDPGCAKAMHETAKDRAGAAPPNAPLVLSRLLSRTDWFTQARSQDNCVPDLVRFLCCMIARRNFVCLAQCSVSICMTCIALTPCFTTSEEN